MTVKKIIITNVLDTKSAFGVFCDDHIQNVFIPSKVFIASNLKVGSVVDALIVPNMKHQEKTPWLAAKIQNEVLVDNTRNKIKNQIIKHLRNVDATSYEISHELNVYEGDVQSILDEMFAEGKVLIDTVYSLRETAHEQA
jgi:hypothetical protein